MAALPAKTNPYRKSWMNNARREEITGWTFAMPWIIGFLLFTFIPMAYSFYTSFTTYNIIKTPEWIGLDNFTALMEDRFFWKALENTFWMVIVKTPIVMVSAIGIAMLLNINMRGAKFFRSIIYLPNVLSGIAAIFLWQWILKPDGLFNSALDVFGIQGPSWFADPSWTKPGMILMSMWWIGGNVLIYLASLKGIPKDLYEAASIDGAVGWQQVRYITLPLLSPTIFFETVTVIIGTFQIFTTAYILSGANWALGGTENSMLFYVLYLYSRAFGKVGPAGFQMGYASAMAWILFIIILAITLFQLWLAKKWVYYESGN